MENGVRLARLEESVKALARRVDEFDDELGSSRRPETLRGRMHALENDRVAAKAAAAALEAARVAREAGRQRTYSKAELAIGAIVALSAVVGALGTAVSLVVLLG